MRGSEHKQFWCSHPGCDKVFNRRDYLERHATNHLKVKPYMCVQCNRHFSRKDLYDNHLTTKRHARVTHEVQQANYENQIGQLGDPSAMDAARGSLDRNELARLKNSSIDSGSMENHMMGNPSESSNGMTFAANPSTFELVSRRGGYDQYDQSIRSMYAPPKQQPLHLPGPGPGLPTPNMATGNSGASYFDDSQRYAYDPLGIELRDMPDGGSGIGSNDVDLPWGSQFSTDSSSNKFQPSPQSSLGTMSSIGTGSLGAANGMMGLGRAGSQGSSVMKYDTTSESGRFSSYGISLGLTGSISAKSDISDDGSSDMDGSAGAAVVSERLRRDMAENSFPMKDLRESSNLKGYDYTASCHSGKRLDSETAPAGLVVVNDSNLRHNCKFGLESSVDVSSTDSKLVDKPSTLSESPVNARCPMEVVSAVTSDSRYAWFFDDVFDTDKAKLGYERCFSDAVEAYQTRYDEYNHLKTNQETGPSKRMSGIGNGIHNITVSNREASQGAPSSRESEEDSASSSSRIRRETPFNLKPMDLLAKAEPISNEEFISKYPNMMNSLSPERAEAVLSILRDVPLDLTSLDVVNTWIHTALIHVVPVMYILHPGTFDPNTAHYSLLVVLTLLGMALTEDRAVANAARRGFSLGFLYVYDSLVQVPNNITPSKLDLPTVNVLQAFSLLLRYERLILLEDGSQVSFTKNSPGKYATNLFFSKTLSAVPQVGEFGTPSKHQPIWATVSSEGYLFHQGADPEAQWREWTLLEAVKRVAHFSFYCDSMATLATPKAEFISIFNMDIHMICPEPVWQAKTPKEFFHIFGNSGIIPDVPYLGLIKSLIRFPRMAQKEENLYHDLPQVRAPWSLFALKVVAHGLIVIVGRLSGLIPHSDEMLEAVIQSRTDPFNNGDIFSKFDRQLQARLYRGLDVWYHYFSAANVDITDRILRTPGSMSIPLCEEFDPTQGCDDMRAVPEYTMIIVLCHYSSFIFVHEDLPVVLQVTANLKMWLETNQSTSLQMLLDYLYMPLYTNWIKTDEAKGMVSACALYLAWNHAAAGNSFYGKNMFLSAMIYVSAVVIWLNDCASNDGPGELHDLRLDKYRFMEDAVEYIHELYKNVCGQGPKPSKRAVNSVLLLSACLLYKRKSTKPFVKMLVQLLSVMDSRYSTDVLISVIKRSGSVYDERAAVAKESITLKDVLPRGDSPADVDGDAVGLATSVPTSPMSPETTLREDRNNATFHMESPGFDGNEADMDSDLANISDLEPDVESRVLLNQVDTDRMVTETAV